jgi:8-oxo-dGTP diphosphatase
MKDGKEKSRMPILAAGGIVLRKDHDLTPQFAVVQSRKLATWGLPKGKLAVGEDAMTAARREVLEETGHHVTVHEFLGTLVYETSGRPKVVQFWRMEAAGAPAGDLKRDVTGVDWLALEDAINRLGHMREQVFLEQVGPIALKLAERPAGAALFRGQDADRSLVPGVPLAPPDEASLSNEAVGWALGERAGPPPFGYDLAARHVSTDAVALASLNRQDRPMAAGMEATCLNLSERHAPQQSLVEVNVAERGLSEWGVSKSGPDEKSLMKKTWGWFRHAAMLHRQPFD